MGRLRQSHSAAKTERVVLMQRGKVVADGPVRDVLVESRLSALFGQPLPLSKRGGYYNLW